MKGPRGDHAKWDQTERKIPFDIIYMWNLTSDSNLFTKQKQIQRHRKQAYGY